MNTHIMEYALKALIGTTETYFLFDTWFEDESVMLEMTITRGNRKWVVVSFGELSYQFRIRKDSIYGIDRGLGPAFAQYAVLEAVQDCIDTKKLQGWPNIASDPKPEQKSRYMQLPP